MKRSPKEKRRLGARSRELVPVQIELTKEQFTALRDWSHHCRAVPEELATAMLMQGLDAAWQTVETDSWEAGIAGTVYDLQKFVDDRRFPAIEARATKEASS